MKYQYSGTLINAGGNAKTVKGDGTEYLTAIMYLRPWKHLISGIEHNLCPSAELAGCITGCLNTAGRGQMNNVQNWRMGKTLKFINDRSAFLLELVADVGRFYRKCQKLNVKACVRLNGTSDIRWELLTVDGRNIFEHYPDVQFYDYTKIANRKTDHIPNYHLTFSYSGANPDFLKQVDIAKARGMNIAVVFRNKTVQPTNFIGLPVVDGDADDLRFLDPVQSVVALYAKGKARSDKSGFVVDI